MVTPDPYAEPEPTITAPRFYPSQPLPNTPPPRKDNSRSKAETPKREPRSPRQGTPPPPTLGKPSKEYQSISATPSTPIADPKSLRKLLILDLNGTLVYRSPHARRNVYQQPNQAAARPLRSVHPRPYLASFRDYIFHPRVKEWLDTMVWSSAQPHSVADMVEKSLGSQEGLLAVWARDTLGLSEEAYCEHLSGDVSTN